MIIFIEITQENTLAYLGEFTKHVENLSTCFFVTKLLYVHIMVVEYFWRVNKCPKKNKYRSVIYKKKSKIKKYRFIILAIIAIIIVIPVIGWIMAIGGLLIFVGWNIIDRKH
ncbi:hypothetical protein CLTEP_03010 [Clostridium tepidiprofundi DSM 19306]|uniref:Uncharacterized protein n=1 Tax=Clostridium tepidiprofundi DSM 19306 TaxID=1121338 RepID=A0A151B7J7_9CLOT|nr:hypothetical protein [Clostridium tepidiprofundi]KYH35908.1 hypothetical protein CLTEP_03010 [Clostridium tepidiprofundi DSM 19306]